MNIGGTNRINQDNCAYQKSLYESTSPLSYQLYMGKHESCSACIQDKFYLKYNLVDVESEVKGINRPLSKCDQLKYNPGCKSSARCVSTFDKNVPRVRVPELCPIVYNNIPKMTHPGYTLPNPDFCQYNY